MSEARFAAPPRGTHPLSHASGDAQARLTTRDRILLLVPTIAAVFFGLAPLLVAVPFARLAGYAGHDPFFYWLAGAATLGYGIALAVGMREGSWPLKGRFFAWMTLGSAIVTRAPHVHCAREPDG
jgi:hypothetical protein